MAGDVQRQERVFAEGDLPDNLVEGCFRKTKVMIRL
jgi:hypothetical protein